MTWEILAGTLCFIVGIVRNIWMVHKRIDELEKKWEERWSRRWEPGNK